MRFTKLLVAVFATSWIATGCQPPAEEAAESEAPVEEAVSDEELIADDIEAFAEAWGDAAAIAGFFTNEGTLVDPTGSSFQGRDAIQARYEELFSGMYEGTTISVNQDSVRFLSDDTAISHGSYELMGLTNAAGEAFAVNGRYMNLSVKQNGEWKMHSNRPMAPVAAPES